MSEEEATKSSEESTDAPSDKAASSDSATEDASTSSEAERPERPRKKKKGRAKKAKASRSELNAEGMERPAFVHDFPADPALEPLVAAFEAGNYAFVREHAARLSESTADAEVKAAALELLRRIEPDPLVKFLLAVAVALFVAVVAYVYHSHGN